MTIELRRSTMVNEANARLINRFNSGISWGTNNHPAYSHLGWFAGPTWGRGHSFNVGHFGRNDTTDATTALANLRYFTNINSGVRLVRIRILVSHWQVGHTVYSDQTAVANTIYDHYGYPEQVANYFSQGTEMHLGTFQTQCDALWNHYWNVFRTNPLLLDNIICHTSCHTSCHGSRGRR